METLCKIRDLYRAIAEFETRFEKAHHLCLNEGMLLCCLSRKKRLSSGEIAEQLGLSNSNTSKVIRSVEDKGYIERNFPVRYHIIAVKFWNQPVILPVDAHFGPAL